MPDQPFHDSTAARRAPSMWVWILGVMLGACGGASEPAATASPTAGAEAPPEEVPTGPPLSYVAQDHTIVMRLDVSQVRDSSLATDIASLIRNYDAWRQLLGNSGIDPVRDFDLVLACAPQTVVGDSVLLVRHHLSNEDIRRAVLTMSVDRGEPPAWREVDGFDVVDWPSPAQPPRIVVLTGPTELVLTTESQLARVIEVAHDHRLRATQEGDAIEPALAFADQVIATVSATELSERTRARIPHPPDAFELALSGDAEEAGRMHIHARGHYPDVAHAEAARSWLVEQQNFYAGQLMVRAVGLDRPLRAAEVATEETDLRLDASLTEEEAQRALGLLAAFEQFN